METIDCDLLRSELGVRRISLEAVVSYVSQRTIGFESTNSMGWVLFSPVIGWDEFTVLVLYKYL